MQQNPNHVVETKMLIRKPVSAVFEAFVNSSETTNFWFTRSTGSLEEGRHFTWHWDMYGVSADVWVKEIIPNKRITIEWGEPKTTVDFKFGAVSEATTYVSISHYGFDQTGDDLIAAIKDSTGGFATVLAGLKAYLEHGINLNLIADKNPKSLSSGLVG